MSVTAEDIMRRMSQSAGKVTAAQIMERKAAADRALQVGTQGMGAPDTGDERTFMERLKGAGAGAALPIVETARGIQELQDTPFPAAQARRMEATGAAQEALEGVPGATENIGAQALGETAMMALPASKAYRLTQAMTKGVPVLQRVAPIVAESAAVGGVEGLKTPEEGETRLGQAMTMAGANLTGAAGQKVLNSVFGKGPAMFRRTELAKNEAADLAKAGITPDIPVTLGTEATGLVSPFVRWGLRGPGMAAPGVRKTLGKQVDKAIGDWREARFRQALPKGAEVPMPKQRAGSEAPIDETLDAIDDWYSQQYKEVLEPFRFDVVRPDSPVGSRINAAMNDIPGEGVRDTIDQKFGDLLQKYGRAGGVSGENISSLKTALRREAKLSQDGVAKSAYYDLLDAISEGVETQIKATHPKLGERYVALKGPYRNFVTLSDAASRKPFGEFSPKDLFAAGQRKARSDKINPLKAPYRPEAQRGMKVYDLDPETREANAFQLNAYTGLAGSAVAGAGASMFHPVGQAATATILGGTAANIPRWSQKYMASEYPYQLWMADMLRKPGMQELSRAARIGGGQYLAE